MRIAIFFVLISMSTHLFAQEEKVVQTFRHSRLINTHSVETLPARKMDFRVVHRFGDLAGTSGGWTTFYGLENASDISIGFEYGLNDNIMIGINRTKGAGPLKQNLNGLIKIKIMNQESKGNLPFSLSVLGVSAYSTMQKSSLEGQITSFARGSHRLAYHLGLHAARKFSDSFSFQGSASWTFRNVVESGDQNDIVAVGAGMRIQVTKAFGLIFDGTFPLLTNDRLTGIDYTIPFGVGLEFDTSGGHVFQINVTNSRGISETDYIPYTTSNWGDGEFRLGFTISRLFSL
jgi:hypothetical protein